jgi:hypothetical protein
MGGVIRDLVLAAPGADARGIETAYIPVFALEIAFLILAVIAIWPLRKRLTARMAGRRRQEAYLA